MPLATVYNGRFDGMSLDGVLVFFALMEPAWSDRCALGLESKRPSLARGPFLFDGNNVNKNVVPPITAQSRIRLVVFSKLFDRD
jgi:hypothetical protein